MVKVKKKYYDKEQFLSAFVIIYKETILICIQKIVKNCYNANYN